ncbi:MAG: transposase, partial [Candidatus Kapaibacteriota bacterium]
CFHPTAKARGLSRTDYRNKIERLWNRLKHCRRIVTRYDKTARNYLSFVFLASTILWLL